MKVIMATGGSGGHIFPAISVARALRSQGHTVAFLGGNTGMEARLVPEDGFTFYGVPTGKWHRGWENLPRLPQEFWRAWRGTQHARTLLKAQAPDLVIGFGGFASLPGIHAARQLGLPYVLHEGNAYPGIVTRSFAKQAALVLLSRAEAKQYLKAGHFAYVPFPVREIVLPKAEARAKLGIPEHLPLTLVMGGSQGSLLLNRVVPEAYQQLTHNIASLPFVLHATGTRWLSSVRPRVQDWQHYQSKGFVDAITAWSAADIAICRSGISSLSEAAFYGVPTVMVPLASSANNHQLHNARSVEASGAGIVVEAQQLKNDVTALVEAWQRLLEPETQQRAREACRRHSPEGAVDLFISLLATIPAAQALQEVPHA